MLGVGFVYWGKNEKCINILELLNMIVLSMLIFNWVPIWCVVLLCVGLLCVGLWWPYWCYVLVTIWNCGILLNGGSYWHVLLIVQPFLRSMKYCHIIELFCWWGIINSRFFPFNYEVDTMFYSLLVCVFVSNAF